MAKASRATPDTKPSAKPTAAPVPQPHGGFLVPGAGGGPQPGSGRPPNVFRDFLTKLRADPKALKALQDAASDATCRNFGNAWKLIGEYDEDKPAEKKQIVGPVEVHVRIAREGRRVTAS